MSEQPNAPYVLIVDDEWMNRELLEAYLKLGGYRVGQANSGEKALEMVKTEVPALIMLDVRLTGIDGYEVCRRLRGDEQTRAVPVLMVTGLESDDERQKATEVGANGFVAKPFNAEAMLQQIKTLIG